MGRRGGSTYHKGHGAEDGQEPEQPLVAGLTGEEASGYRSDDRTGECGHHVWIHGVSAVGGVEQLQKACQDGFESRAQGWRRTHVSYDGRRRRQHARAPEARKEAADDHSLDGLGESRCQCEETEAGKGDEEDWPAAELLGERRLRKTAQTFSSHALGRSR
jgi:hypothetical protein